MELSPQSVSSTTFKIVKKGYDPDEVRAYLTQLASSIEMTQNQAAAMEARARAAVVRLQEIAAQAPQQVAQPVQVAQPAPAPMSTSSDDSETISRTLLLAQRTADATIADANEQARRATEAANAEARTIVAGAQEMANRLVDEGRSEARRAGEGQRVQIESEVQSLLARREFLLSDVEHLEQHVVTHRDRLRDVATSITELVDKVPGGLGDIRRPLMSAVGDADTAALVAPAPPAASVASTYEAMPDPAPMSAAAAVDVASEPHLDETEAMPRVDTSGYDNIDLAPAAAPAPTPAPVVSDVMPAATADLDPIWLASSTDSMKPDETFDATPPSGITNQFLFDDITAEVPRVQQIPNDDLTMQGDQPN